jgi:CBS domain-containing protein
MARAQVYPDYPKCALALGAECVRPNNSLQQAAHKMKCLDVGPLPVCDEDHLVGIITDRDITVRAVAKACDALLTTVEEVMTPDVVYCYEDDEVEDAARLMRDHQIRRLVVLNRDRRLAGIVSLGDLAVETGDEKLASETLEQVSLPVQ